MSTTAVAAKGIGLLVDDVDVTKLFSSAGDQFERDYIDVSVFGTDDREGMPSLRGSALSLEGFRKGDHVGYQDIIDRIITNASNHKVAMAPQGFAVGNRVYIMDSHENSAQVSAVVSGAVMLSVVFGATGGSRLGRVLRTHVGASSVSYNQHITLTADNAAGDASLVVGDSSLGAGGNVTVDTADNAAAVKASLEALAAITTAVVSGSLSTGGGTNWAETATLTASSELGGFYTVDKLNDGDVTAGNFWASGTTTPPHWIALDLGAAHVFNKLRLYLHAGGGAGGITDFRLEVSATGLFAGEETTVLTVNGLTPTSGWWEWTFAPQNKQYARLYITGVDSDNYANLRELELIEPDGTSGSFDIEITSPSAETINFSTGTDGWTVDVINNGGAASLLNLITTTVNGASVDNGAATTRGATAHLHVVHAAGSGRTLTVKIQHSTNNSAWTDLITFAPVTDPAALRMKLDDGVTVNRYTRAVVSAVTGTFAATVALSRYGDVL